MKTMSDYTLFCTPEQTRKAFDLGAPISEGMERHNAWNAMQRIKSGKETYEEYANKGVAIINGKYVVKALTIPTDEQMIGWLEEETLGEIRIEQDTEKKWAYTLFNNRYEFDMSYDVYYSRKEATIAAIDAALEYLTNKKQ